MTANFGCIRNVVGYSDWHQILVIGVHGAWEMPTLLMADHRVKSRSNLIAGGDSYILGRGVEGYVV